MGPLDWLPRPNQGEPPKLLLRLVGADRRQANGDAGKKVKKDIRLTLGHFTGNDFSPLEREPYTRRAHL